MFDLDPTPGFDLSSCEQEPIHQPGSIQPHGYLLAVEGKESRLVQASANTAELFGCAVEAALGRPLAELLPAAADAWKQVADQGTTHLRRLPVPLAPGSTSFIGVVHRSDDLLILELEPSLDLPVNVIDTLDAIVNSLAGDLQMTAGLDGIASLAARQVRRVIGFDRVLVYRFDEAWHGTVIAEDRNEVLPSYLGLRFPASDIPRQARELYRLNRMRLIPTADYQPVPIVPALHPRTNRPLDLSLAGLRSVSPVHLEYMRNMGTGASMSISLLRDGDLWGLISCHNQAPRYVPVHLRTTCELIGQLASLQIGRHEHTREVERRIELRGIATRLLNHMAAADRFADGLARHGQELLRLTHAGGAAILHEGRCILIGATPPETAVHEIVGWVGTRGEEVFATDSLADEMPGAERYKETACGLLAAAVSQLHPSYVLWFRPEVVRDVSWGGDPTKPVEPAPAGLRLHPRRSFELWRERVDLRSLPWRAAEIEAVRELRGAIVGIVMRKAEEMAALNEELKRSNRELEAFSYSVSHDLRAPFRHIVGYSELLREQEGDRLSERGRRYVTTVIEAAFSAARLIDGLLDFSRMGRTQLSPTRIDMAALLRELQRSLERETEGRQVTWRIGELGPVLGDPMMLRLAFHNLLSNALKYTRPRPEAVIEVGSAHGEHETIFFVRDNGVGFDMAYVSKLFGVFQRLHLAEDFEGTGVGLANVRRIVERHGGRVWAEGALNRGATFYVSLPNEART